jgi:hypothetical protein
MTLTATVDNPPGDNKHGRLISDLCCERVDLEDMLCVAAAKQSVGEFPCGGGMFHVIQCITDGTPSKAIWSHKNRKYFVRKKHSPSR